MFRDYLKALPIAALLTLFVVTVSYVIHRNDSSRNSVGSAQIYIDDQGMEVAGDRAVVIARSGSTVILYKGASLIDSKLDSLSTRADFAFNFDDLVAFHYGADAFPIVWASRTIAQAGSLIMAGAGSRVLVEDGARVIYKNEDAPAYLWDSQADERVIYDRAHHELD